MVSSLVCWKEGWKSGSQANATHGSLLHSVRGGDGAEGYGGMQMKPQTILILLHFPFNTIKTLNRKGKNRVDRNLPLQAPIRQCENGEKHKMK